MENSKNKINLLRDFIGISHWQTLIALIIIVIMMIGLSQVIKKTKMKFPHRVFLGIGLGLIFGITMQAVTGFNVNNISYPQIPDPNNPGKTMANPNYVEWVGQVSLWISVLKNIFITGIAMLTVPIIFLAIARICAQKTNSNQKLINLSLSGIIILLINVAVAFVIAFSLGIVFKIGNQFNLASSGTYDHDANKSLPNIITGYIPNSFIGAFTQFLIIPVIILGALVGFAIKKSTKRYETAMDQARNALEIMWKIIISILMFFVKIMPFAVFSMLATVIINQPIADLGRIGIIIGVAYLALFITFLWHLLTLFLFGIKPLSWLKRVQQPLISGFTTQSSNAALPIAMESLKNSVGVDEAAANTVMPLSTTIGLSGCAGVQSGIILSFLYFSVINHGLFPEWTIPILFINGLIVTIIASLGIAGVPGTASVVTAGVLGGLGFGSFYYSVYGIIGALDGLFDMGRTALNISGGLQTTTIVAKSQNLINNDEIQTPHYLFHQLNQWSLLHQIKRRVKRHQQTLIMELKNNYKISLNNIKSKTKNPDLLVEFQQKIKAIRLETKNKIEAISNLEKTQKLAIKQLQVNYKKQKQTIKQQKTKSKSEIKLLQNQYISNYFKLEKANSERLNALANFSKSNK